ncbi:hypothetical protein HGP16_12130 [Rhizobium sp. P40RR-XXII]|uniref:hypothetical protein n=1 Tax=unclassified Rhizobium TaxID=2613769 RepID=UPI001456CF44|nr:MULTISPECIES: hypothetical protein [unclassified Rhizobium]NLR86634.1 hypothetical protein [Rhizobium sp. P28RR-XV]NLS17306.1 hypothetical protein [Rhizobium sp. P40RR-XXII]
MTEPRADLLNPGLLLGSFDAATWPSKLYPSFTPTPTPCEYEVEPDESEERLRLDKSELRVDGKDIGFSPGMTVTVDVVTSTRRLISYFFEPITKAIQNGLKER